MRDDKKNIIVEKTLQLSLLIIDYSELLEEKRKADFIHKMKIAAKEADELEYWLVLCQLSKHYPYCNTIQEKLVEIIKILSKIISSSKGSFSNLQIN